MQKKHGLKMEEDAFVSQISAEKTTTSIDLKVLFLSISTSFPIYIFGEIR